MDASRREASSADGAGTGHDDDADATDRSQRLAASDAARAAGQAEGASGEAVDSSWRGSDCEGVSGLRDGAEGEGAGGEGVAGGAGGVSGGRASRLAAGACAQLLCLFSRQLAFSTGLLSLLWYSCNLASGW